MKTGHVVSAIFIKMTSRLRRSFIPAITVIAILSGFSIIAAAKPGRPITHKKAKTVTTLVNTSPVVRLEIHHININNGDASVIRLRHKDGTETKVLIDGGQSDATTYLVPYINAVFKDANFQYTILTHYHNDHYKGLRALGTGAIRSEYYIDLGGYNMEDDVEPGKLALIQPKDIICPWTDSTGVFEKSMAGYIASIGIAANNYGLKRYMPLSKPGDSIQYMVGVKIPLGVFTQGTATVPIELRCVAAWGFTQDDNKVTDDWHENASKNDPSLGFVLECGEFRYFFGGDMGGSSGSNYIDQETTLAKGFAYLYKGAKSYYKPAATYDGHICGFKANHHGSAESNNSTFLGQMHPAVCVTSAGSNDAWHLPSIPFLIRLNATTPITPAADFPTDPTPPPFLKAQGFFFTNLYNFTKGNDSKTEAKKLFDNRLKTAFQYGSIGTTDVKAGYEVFLLLDNNQTVDYRRQSAFAVSDIDTAYKVSPIIAVIYCHQK
ncbi:MBL fold metallo-hydrolase [Mucilaginibacter sp. X4EP1]|uniref:MBL fold metallo-hydrolase n=1 Tax=Mucilaginibacter sp. X4EP1 TaxID=2723092 RepID=UPI0021676718|nr:MBL fold metallo-hydrolase [Mucilaginibacter sp. X4EP1]MCS3811627.1 hypothetical protein [Mucilaginibacter sp. X4EP1]